MRAKDSATMQLNPASIRDRGACSLEEPHPKFFPATRMSPFPTMGTKPGLTFSNMKSLRWSRFVDTRRSAGMIWSVSTSSPNLHTFPSTVLDTIQFPSSCAGVTIFPAMADAATTSGPAR